MLTRFALFVGLFILPGCISVPDDVRADFVQPDGSRANNYGRFVELPDTDTVLLKHDAPTVPPAPKAEPTPERKAELDEEQEDEDA